MNNLPGILIGYRCSNGHRKAVPSDDKGRPTVWSQTRASLASDLEHLTGSSYSNTREVASAEVSSHGDNIALYEENGLLGITDGVSLAFSVVINRLKEEGLVRDRHVRR